MIVFERFNSLTVILRGFYLHACYQTKKIDFHPRLLPKILFWWLFWTATDTNSPLLCFFFWQSILLKNLRSVGWCKVWLLHIRSITCLNNPPPKKNWSNEELETIQLACCFYGAMLPANRVFFFKVEMYGVLTAVLFWLTRKWLRYGIESVYWMTPPSEVPFVDFASTSDHPLLRFGKEWLWGWSIHR